MNDKVDKSYAAWIMVKLTRLDYMQLVIYKSHNHNIIIVFSLGYGLYQIHRYRYKCNFGKKLPNLLAN